MIPIRSRVAAVGAGVALLVAGGAIASTQAVAAPHAIPTCNVSGLSLAIGQPQGAAGSFLYPINFTNKSAGECALRGYPGVSVLDANHHQIGTPATENGQPVTTVYVAPGKTVTATIRTNDPGVDPNCRATSAYIGVYPPAGYQQALIPYQLRVCGIFQISPVQS